LTISAALLISQLSSPTRLVYHMCGPSTASLVQLARIEILHTLQYILINTPAVASFSVSGA